MSHVGELTSTAPAGSIALSWGTAREEPTGLWSLAMGRAWQSARSLKTEMLSILNVQSVQSLSRVQLFVTQ